MKYIFKDRSYTIKRYPKTNQSSLRAWNAADEHILKYLEEEKIKLKNIVLYNDRFGFLSTLLAEHKPRTILNFKSQEKSVEINLQSNDLELESIIKTGPLDKIKPCCNLALIKIPKSLDLFRLQMEQLYRASKKETIIICAFMTKYFSPQMLDICSEYYELCDQSKAWKKSRLIVLKNKKKRKESEIKNKINFSNSKKIVQYFGVFSAKKIDYATQFFIENMVITLSDNKILDLGSGNGVLAYEAQRQKPDAEVHLVDDSFLAIESSKINVDPKRSFFYYQDDLAHFEDNSFDMVLSNPPFHFEHEINIDVSISLFKEVKRCLKKGGSFQLVTSNHLNLKTQLHDFFHKVNVVDQNKKFIIYNCT